MGLNAQFLTFRLKSPYIPPYISRAMRENLKDSCDDLGRNEQQLTMPADVLHSLRKALKERQKHSQPKNRQRCCETAGSTRSVGQSCSKEEQATGAGTLVLVQMRIRPVANPN